MMWAAAWLSLFMAPSTSYSIEAQSPAGRYMYLHPFRVDGSFYVYLWWT